MKQKQISFSLSSLWLIRFIEIKESSLNFIVLERILSYSEMPSVFKSGNNS